MTVRDQAGEIETKPHERRAPETATSPVVRMDHVAFSWPGARPGGRNFSIDIDAFQLTQSERLLLLGPSGGGKSTMLSLLAGIVQPRSGAIEVLGTQTTKLGATARDRFRAEHFGIIFQMFNLLPYGAVTDNVLLPLSFAPKRRKRAESSGDLQEVARNLLAELGLGTELFASSTASLSVGQQQRVAAARALIGAPEIIIADEPTSALDSESQKQFMSLLFKQLAAAGSSLIMVSHDETLKPYFDRVCRLSDLIQDRSAS